MVFRTSGFSRQLIGYETNCLFSNDIRMDGTEWTIYAHSETVTSRLYTIVIWRPRSKKSDVCEQERREGRFSRALRLYDLPPPPHTP